MTDWLMDITNPDLGYKSEDMLKFKELPPSVVDKLDGIQKRKKKGVLDAVKVLRAMRFMAGVHQSIVTRIPGLGFSLEGMIASLSGPLGSALTKVSFHQKDDDRFLVTSRRGKQCQRDYNGVQIKNRFNPIRSEVNSYQIIQLLGYRQSIPGELMRCDYPITTDILSGGEVWNGILVSCHICGPIDLPTGMERCQICREVTCAEHLLYPFADGRKASICTKCARRMNWVKKPMFVAKNQTGHVRNYFIDVSDMKRGD